MSKLKSDIYWYNKKLGNDYNRNEITRTVALILMEPLDLAADLCKFFMVILNKLPFKQNKKNELYYSILAKLCSFYFYFEETLPQKMVNFLNWFFQIPEEYN